MSPKFILQLTRLTFICYLLLIAVDLNLLFNKSNVSDPKIVQDIIQVFRPPSEITSIFRDEVVKNASEYISSNFKLQKEYSHSILSNSENFIVECDISDPSAIKDRNKPINSYITIPYLIDATSNENVGDFFDYLQYHSSDNSIVSCIDIDSLVSTINIILKERKAKDSWVKVYIKSENVPPIDQIFSRKMNDIKTNTVNILVEYFATSLSYFEEKPTNTSKKVRIQIPYIHHKIENSSLCDFISFQTKNHPELNLDCNRLIKNMELNSAYLKEFRSLNKYDALDRIGEVSEEKVLKKQMISVFGIEISKYIFVCIWPMLIVTLIFMIYQYLKNVIKTYQSTQNLDKLTSKKKLYASLFPLPIKSESKIDVRWIWFSFFILPGIIVIISSIASFDILLWIPFVIYLIAGFIAYYIVSKIVRIFK